MSAGLYMLYTASRTGSVFCTHSPLGLAPGWPARQFSWMRSTAVWMQGGLLCWKDSPFTALRRRHNQQNMLRSCKHVMQTLNFSRQTFMQVKLTHRYAMQPDLMPDQASTVVVEGKNLKLCVSLPARGQGLSRSWWAILHLCLSQPYTTHHDPANQQNCLLFAGNSDAKLGDQSQQMHADVATSLMVGAWQCTGCWALGALGRGHGRMGCCWLVLFCYTTSGTGTLCTTMPKYEIFAGHISWHAHAVQQQEHDRSTTANITRTALSWLQTAFSWLQTTQCMMMFMSPYASCYHQLMADIAFWANRSCAATSCPRLPRRVHHPLDISPH